MDTALLQWFHSLPPWLITVLAAVVPVTELRGSIPLGIQLGLSPLEAFLLSVIGNTLPLLFILPWLSSCAQWISKRSRLGERLFSFVCQRVQRKLRGKETLEGFALALFVGIPLPGTGVWTAMIATLLLGLPFSRAFPFLFLGVILAGVIVTFISIGIFTSLHFLL